MAFKWVRYAVGSCALVCVCVCLCVCVCVPERLWPRLTVSNKKTKSHFGAPSYYESPHCSSPRCHCVVVVVVVVVVVTGFSTCLVADYSAVCG